ncbi:MAG: serine acetyltransferase [Fibrobacter sp.]|nr:serine acetyltransferase [Fibrobacter sp.]
MKRIDSIIKEDSFRFERNMPKLKDKILKNESWYIWQYIKHMRYIEFHQDKGGFHRLAYLWHWYKFKHLQFKLHFAIYPNTIGPGFRIYHVGAYTHVGPNVKIGRNCTMVSGVVFGNKNEEEDNRPVIVGDNCYFGMDCKILGPVKIGNNVTIGANAIVTKDIPDNAIVGGVNKILKFKD